MIEALQPDLRGTPLWERVTAHFHLLYEPGFGLPGEPTDPAVSADGSVVACTVTIRTDLESPARQAVVVLRVDGGPGATIGDPSHSVRLPRLSPVSTDELVVLTDSGSAGVFRPALVRNGVVLPLPPLTGITENVQWSPDGLCLLALVAEPGADAAGAQGSGRISRGDAPDWLPVVSADRPVGGWRRLWTLRVGDEAWTPASPEGTTCWEAAWAGPDRVVAIASTRPEEAAWFAALPVLVTPDELQPLLDPDDRCLGLPAISPDARWAAVVRATCSDRTVVAGDVTVIGLHTDADERVGLGAASSSVGAVRVLDLGGLDVTWQAFRSRTVLVVAGQHGLDTVVAEVDVVTGAVTELWRSGDLTCGQRYPELSVGTAGTALVVEGYHQPPELAVLGSDGPQIVSSFAHGGHDAALDGAGELRAVSWHASDSVVVDGLLVLPAGGGPHPLVTYVHGGPVWAWRSRWSMGYAYTLLLARHGYAVLHPNPRGSSGRGEAFRAAVLGDLGGAECDDLLSGLDELVERGIADPARLGLFGGSHGGFVASWLVTQTDRFAAAVPYCPVTDWGFQRLTSNDQAAQDHLLAGRPSRDPLAHAADVTTPTMVLTGSRDLITPASQGLAFHRAVAQAGAPTGYVEYPLEGHGVRTFPAQIDFSARLLGWFDHFMGGARGERPDAHD